MKEEFNNKLKFSDQEAKVDSLDSLKIKNSFEFNRELKNQLNYLYNP